MKFPCPKCEQPGISPKDKHRLCYWRETHCDECDARLCANPWFLAPYSLIYMWALATCAFLFLFQGVGAMAFVYALLAWLVIDLFNVLLIPMAVMRSVGPGPQDPLEDLDAELDADVEIEPETEPAKTRP